MAVVKKREYLFAIDEFNRPEVVDGKRAIAILVVRLILLEPGSDPLHPDMGVGIRQYRYSLNQLKELSKKIDEQIATYLPDFSYVNVDLVQDPIHKICNIEITVDDVVYVYDSLTSRTPIQISDVINN